jgi:hypothetical protein
MASKSTVDLGLRLFLMALRKHLILIATRSAAKGSSRRTQTPTIQLYNTRRSGNSGD